MATKLLLLFLAAVSATASAKKLKAVAIIRAASAGVEGDVIFKERKDGWVEIKGKIRGLRPGPYGVHIHGGSDISSNCAYIGDHYDPHDEPHGSHVGDVIYAYTDKKGELKFKLDKRNIRLDGPYGIVGLTVGLTLGEKGPQDDYLGLPTVACGIIVPEDPKKFDKYSHH